jgi:hypothetical protein
MRSFACSGCCVSRKKFCSPSAQFTRRGGRSISKPSLTAACLPDQETLWEAPFISHASSFADAIPLKLPRADGESEEESRQQIAFASFPDEG